MKFRPCIDLHQGRVKQIVGGTLTNSNAGLVENFVSDKDAAYFAELFKRDHLTGGHLIMLGPGNQEQALKALQAYPNGLQIGGGITADNAATFLEAGAAQVIITSYVFHDGVIDQNRLEQLLKEIGREKVVLDLSCRKKDGRYFVVTDRWQKFTEFEITSANLMELVKYCVEFLIHAADVEGLCQGIDVELVKSLGLWGLIPTTYAGGIKSKSDVDLIRKFGFGKLDYTIGSALDIFGGKLPYREVLSWNC